MPNLINPFNFVNDPIDRLLLINFEKDPDNYYIGFEPQVYNDPLLGSIHLIIGWRHDGKVDIYHPGTFRPDPKKYDIAGDGAANIISTELDIAFFEINDLGVHAHYRFTDLYQRPVEIIISEANHKKRKPFGLLAPMGDAASKPSAMPLIFLYDFYFVRRKHTTFSIMIGGRYHQPDKLPMAMDWAKMYFTRYSPSPHIVMFNPAFDGIISSVQLQENMTEIKDDVQHISIEWMNGAPCIQSITIHNRIHPLTISFTPSFPSVCNLEQNTFMTGNFKISGHPSTGNLEGVYAVKSGIDEISISVDPSKGWKPNINKFSLAFMYKIAGVFTKWPKTYKWDAVLTRSDENSWKMKSEWTRTGRAS